MKQEVPLPLPPKDHPPAFVLGGDEDVIVDIQALEESGEVYGVKPVILKNAAHDIMLVSCFLIILWLLNMLTIALAHITALRALLCQSGFFAIFVA